MCGLVKSVLEGIGLVPKAPKGVDPAAERAIATAEAQQRANATMAMSRRARRQNSLFTGGGEAGSAAGTSATLGVG